MKHYLLGVLFGYITRAWLAATSLLFIVYAGITLPATLTAAGWDQTTHTNSRAGTAMGIMVSLWLLTVITQRTIMLTTALRRKWRGLYRLADLLSCIAILAWIGMMIEGTIVANHNGHVLDIKNIDPIISLIGSVLFLGLPVIDLYTIAWSSRQRKKEVHGAMDLKAIIE